MHTRIHCEYERHLHDLHIKKFQSSNSRSEPFNMISILKCAWRPNFIFFEICLLFIKYFTKLLLLDNSGPLKNNSFVKYLINSKTIQKKYKIWSPSTF